MVAASQVFSGTAPLSRSAVPKAAAEKKSHTGDLDEAANRLLKLLGLKPNWTVNSAGVTAPSVLVGPWGRRANVRQRDPARDYRTCAVLSLILGEISRFLLAILTATLPQCSGCVARNPARGDPRRRAERSNIQASLGSPRPVRGTCRSLIATLPQLPCLHGHVACPACATIGKLRNTSIRDPRREAFCCVYSPA